MSNFTNQSKGIVIVLSDNNQLLDSISIFSAAYKRLKIVVNNDSFAEDLIPTLIIDLQNLSGITGIGPRWKGILDKSGVDYQDSEQQVIVSNISNRLLKESEISTIFLSDDVGSLDTIDKIFKYLNG